LICEANDIVMFYFTLCLRIDYVMSKQDIVTYSSIG